MDSNAYDQLALDLRTAGYKRYVDPRDEMTIHCPACGKARTVFGYRRDGSYRGFVSCSDCQKVEEF